MRFVIFALAGCCLLQGCQGPPETAAVEVAPGSVLWTYHAGAELWGPLELEDGVLYFGDDNGTFRALETMTRELRWQFATDGRIRSAAELAGGSVLFASDDGFLYALDRESGSERWRFHLGSSGIERRLPATDPPYAYDYLHSSPVADEGIVYVGSADGHLYAVDLESGQQRWRFATGEKVRSSPTVTDGVVHFGSWDGHVYALDSGTGEEIWRFDSGGPVQGSPAVTSGLVIVGSRSARVFGLDEETGDVVWTHVHEDGSWVESSPVVVGDVVYIGSSDALKLFALEVATGAKLWHFETGGWSWGTPVTSEDTVYIGGISAYPYYFEGVDLEAGFYAVDRRTGQERWRMEPEALIGYITGGVFSPPRIAAGVVYVASVGGQLYALKD
jgi:outer membrane protein assembly factor BamB